MADPQTKVFDSLGNKKIKYPTLFLECGAPRHAASRPVNDFPLAQASSI
jgi:hypothetical protein